MIRSNSYFSGGGIFDLGFRMADIDILQAFEIDPVACQTLRMNYGHEINECDITQKTVLDDKDANVLIGTFPCKKYSNIADIKGTRTGDELVWHFFRHVVLKRPDAFIMENVPGMRKFSVVMEALTKIPGYYTTVFCPVNSNMWLPQNRERLIILGTRRYFNWNTPTSQHKPIKLKDIIEPDAEIEITKSMISRLNGTYRDKPIISDPAKDDIAPTCLAHYHRDRSTRLVVDKRSPLGVRPYTPREYARLQGLPDIFRIAGNKNQQFIQIGNGVPVPFGYWFGKELKRYFKMRRA